MIRFPLSTGDQGLLRIWCYFKTMPDYGAKVGVLIHTAFFEKRQAVYLRFCFWDFLYGRRFAIQPRNPA